jgi:hypothetical protein
MNTQYDSIHRFTAGRSLRNRQTKPLNGEASSEDETKVQKIDYESIVWIVSCLATILGVVGAALSEEPLFWLAVWPMPVTFASAIFLLCRQGFHLEDGVLVLGRRRSIIR